MPKFALTLGRALKLFDPSSPPSKRREPNPHSLPLQGGISKFEAFTIEPIK
jgi:hypothetical protein